MSQEKWYVIQIEGQAEAILKRDFEEAHKIARASAEQGHPAKIWQTGPRPVYEIS